MDSNQRVITAQAPVNIAVIKYWGKKDEELKVPINDSISATLSISEMCTTTTIRTSSGYEIDQFWLNGTKQNLTEESPAYGMIQEFRRQKNIDEKLREQRVQIISCNNFPTAAGLASSAAGYACLAFALGHLYGLTEPAELSKIARKGSGSACRSVYGGFVHWIRGHDHTTSLARQIVDHHHWPEMRVIICVVNDRQKDVPSSRGMRQSVKTSSLIEHRADVIVPLRIDEIKRAILEKDFETFAMITMQDSNQFHAICLDTDPPIFYLNETSRQIIKICTFVNEQFAQRKVAYTFDAGPNACIYILENFVDQFIDIIKKLFPVMRDDGTVLDLEVKGKEYNPQNAKETDKICHSIMATGFEPRENLINYLINTSVGTGPQLVDTHLDMP